MPNSVAVKLLPLGALACAVLVLLLSPFSSGGPEAAAAGDVGLGGSNRENVNAAAVDAAGNIYLSVAHGFSVNGLSGLDEDVFMCNSPTTGADTSCSSFMLFFDGDTYGLEFGSNDVNAIDVP